MGSSLICRFKVGDTGEQMLLETTMRHFMFQYLPNPNQQTVQQILFTPSMCQLGEVSSTPNQYNKITLNPILYLIT